MINNLFQYIYFAIGRSGGSGNFMGRGGNYGGGSGGGGGGSYSRGKSISKYIVIPLPQEYLAGYFSNSTGDSCLP